MAQNTFFLTKTMISEIKDTFQPPESTDSSQNRNIFAKPLIPQDCHLFLRNEPDRHDLELSTNLHRHYLLLCCLDGKGCMAVENIPYILSVGEALLIAPGQPHRRLPLGDEKVQWLFIRFSLDHEPEWLTIMRNQLFHLETEQLRLLEEFRNSCAGFRLAEDSEILASECILRLALLLNTLRSPDGINNPAPEEIPPAVKRLCRILVTPQGDSKRFTEIAREQGVSTGHLRMLFKKATGKTPSEVRNNERRRRAVHLLTHSRLNISEIAGKLGFGSIYAFSRFFKKCTGVSPLRYRNANRNHPEQNDHSLPEI